METVVIKLGGSLITEKKRDTAAVRPSVLKRLARELHRVQEETARRLVVVHGAGPFGHVPAHRYRLAEGFTDPAQAGGIAETRAAMEELNQEVVSALGAAGLHCVGVQPSAGGILDNGRIAFFALEPVERFLSLGLVPVLYGDVLCDRSRGCAILSGDQLAVYLAINLKARRLIAATDVDGLFVGDPRLPGARKLDVVTPALFASLKTTGASGTDVTGGMAGKVQELFEAAAHGIHTEIVNGCRHDVVFQAASGKTGLGTIVVSGGGASEEEAKGGSSP